MFTMPTRACTTARVAWNVVACSHKRFQLQSFNIFVELSCRLATILWNEGRLVIHISHFIHAHTCASSSCPFDIFFPLDSLDGEYVFHHCILPIFYSMFLVGFWKPCYLLMTS